MSANGHQKSTYELVGGAEAVKAAVEILYEKLMSDGNCRQFFENTDMRKLKAHQVQMRHIRVLSTAITFVAFIGLIRARKGADMGEVLFPTL